ncbi:MAG: hypothetical protein ACOZB0_11265 [Pseudomonadota bacterium]
MEFTADHYAAPGRVVVEFQTIECVISAALIRFIHPTEPTSLNFAHLVVNELTFTNRLKLLAAYLSTHPIEHFVSEGDPHLAIKKMEYKEESEYLLEGLRLAGEAEAERNQLVHSQWLADPACGPVGTVCRTKVSTRAKTIKVAQEFLSVADILAVAAKAEKAWKLIQSSTSHLHILLCSKTSS